MIDILLPILHKFLKPLLFVGIVLFAYEKGRYDERMRNALKSSQIERINENRYIREVDNVEFVKGKIKEDIIKNPSNDFRDSCILSNDPFTQKCI